jgi:catechol 2,3-dioxygenase-like lactoylglutathione lyase family enzyme
MLSALTEPTEGASVGIKGVDHIVVRVRDLDAAVESYRKIFDMEPRRTSSDALKAQQAFFDLDNGTAVELIMPTDPASPLAGPLEKRGEGIHSIAFAVDDRKKTAAGLAAREVRTIGDAFVHPGAAHGVLLQLLDG